MQSQLPVTPTAQQAIHLTELRLLMHQDIPEETRPVIKSVCEKLRDDLCVTENILRLWNEETARAAGMQL